MRLKIFCEDSHGVRFFEKLIERLKQEKLFDNSVGVKVGKYYGPCNTKMKRLILASYDEYPYDKFLIICDLDKKAIDDVKPLIVKHIPEEYLPKGMVILCDWEIEEWICVSAGIKIDDKPSTILKKREYYEKYMLPKYVDKLDFDKLKSCKSFNEFRAALDK